MSKPFNLLLLDQGKGPDDRDLPLKQGLNREHGADFGAIKNIKEKGFDDVILVVSEGDLLTVESMGNAENTFPSLPGAEEARIFPILRTVGQPSDFCFLDVVS